MAETDLVPNKVLLLLNETEDLATAQTEAPDKMLRFNTDKTNAYAEPGIVYRVGDSLAPVQHEVIPTKRHLTSTGATFTGGVTVPGLRPIVNDALQDVKDLITSDQVGVGFAYSYIGDFVDPVSGNVPLSAGEFARWEPTIGAGKLFLIHEEDETENDLSKLYEDATNSSVFIFRNSILTSTSYVFKTSGVGVIIDPSIYSFVIEDTLLDTLTSLTTPVSTKFSLSFREKGNSDHGALSGLGDDDHTQYSRADGLRAFTGTVSGVDPTLSAHLATKSYVDARNGFYFVNNLTELKSALASINKHEKTIFIAGNTEGGKPGAVFDIGAGDTWFITGRSKVIGVDLYIDADPGTTLTLSASGGNTEFVDFHATKVICTPSTITSGQGVTLRFRSIDAPDDLVVAGSTSLHYEKLVSGTITGANALNTFWDNTSPGVDVARHTSLKSGVLTGLGVDINAGDDELLDVVSGTGYIEDWTDPANPVGRNCSYVGVTGQAVPNLATGVFTVLAVRLKSPLVPDGNNGFEGELFLQSGVLFTNKELKTQITLQLISHTSGTELGIVDGSSIPAYGVLDNVLEYIRALGPINNGNAYSSNGTTDGAQKAIGSTSSPFLNRMNDPDDPVPKTDIAQPNSVFTPSFVNSAFPGGFEFQAPTAVINTTLWDDGSDVLQTIPPNKWSVKRMTFFSQTQEQGLSYGNDYYNNSDDAIASIFSESPAISPFNINGSFTTALICQEGADLSNPAEAFFFTITNQTASSGAAAITTKLLSFQLWRAYDGFAYYGVNHFIGQGPVPDGEVFFPVPYTLPVTALAGSTFNGAIDVRNTAGVGTVDMFFQYLTGGSWTSLSSTASVDINVNNTSATDITIITAALPVDLPAGSSVRLITTNLTSLEYDEFSVRASCSIEY